MQKTSIQFIVDNNDDEQRQRNNEDEGRIATTTIPTHWRWKEKKHTMESTHDPKRMNEVAKAKKPYLKEVVNNYDLLWERFGCFRKAR
jgi:hypothetical protein